MGLAAVPTTRRSTTTPSSTPSGASAPRARAADRVQRAGRRPAGHRRRGGRDRAGGPDEACAYTPTSERPSAARSSTTRGLGFLLADMAAAVAGARATYLDAARRRDAGGRIHSTPVSLLVATDAAMKVTTDAVQVLGGSATPATTAWSATCARPRSPRFSRAPTRFSARSSHAPYEHVITGA